ncbi:hypothetical protein LZ31DRAFT_33179 [Colletotrichum somersetense]|nr:hypothetical protein LZ31DRAFT_33179 [Colletotrichum somersetense]
MQLVTIGRTLVVLADAVGSSSRNKSSFELNEGCSRGVQIAPRQIHETYVFMVVVVTSNRYCYVCLISSRTSQRSATRPGKLWKTGRGRSLHHAYIDGSYKRASLHF